MLGQRQGGAELAARHSRQEIRLLLVRPRVKHRLAAIDHRPKDPKAEVHHRPPGLFQENGDVEGVATQTTMLLRDAEAEPAGLSKRIERLTRRPFVVIAATCVLSRANPLQHLAQDSPLQLLLFSEMEIHGAVGALRHRAVYDAVVDILADFGGHVLGPNAPLILRRILHQLGVYVGIER